MPLLWAGVIGVCKGEYEDAEEEDEDIDMERDLWWWEVEMGMGSEGLKLSRVLGEDMVAVIVKTGNPAV